jgi:NAD(P)-dependent dehydrogenase (short-subunit alcohol dehydrogenase family)
MANALIWGASGGIGRALVRILKQNGWQVFAAARDITRIPDEADFTYTFDAAIPATISETQLLVAQDSRGLDLVIYAAGSLRPALLKKTEPDDWSVVIDANLTGAFLAASGSLYMLNDAGHLMFMGAYVDHVTLPKMASYAVAKAGLETMVDILRKENRRQRFSVVRPGAVDTAFWENAPFKKPANAKSPEAIAQAILEHYNKGENSDLNL